MKVAPNKLKCQNVFVPVLQSVKETRLAAEKAIQGGFSICSAYDHCGKRRKKSR